MKRLTATLCLTIAVLLGSVGMSASADFQKGFAAWLNEDYATALRIWKPLAEQGNASAQNGLGILYNNGDGVPQDDKTAVKWYRLAAKQGHANAQLNMGLMYQYGEGVTQDNVYAHMWLNIAASNGDENGGKMRDLVAKEMTPTQLEKAQDLSRECVRKKYKGC